MSNTELLKEKLHLLIEKIEDELNTKNDWYEEIPDAVKIRLQKSILQIKGGKAKDLETVLNKY